MIAIPPKPLRPPAPAEDLALSIRLSANAGVKPIPPTVTAILERHAIPYVLIGAHAISAYRGHPRAGHDVDVLTRHPRRAMRALRASFHKFDVERLPCKIRLHWQKKDRIDIWLVRSELDELVLDEAVEIVAGKWVLRIPSLEGAIASKFAGLSDPAARLGFASSGRRGLQSYDYCKPEYHFEQSSQTRRGAVQRRRNPDPAARRRGAGRTSSAAVRCSWCA